MELTDYEKARYALMGSFLDFTRFFFKERTGSKFFISQPLSREPHVVTIARALSQVFRGEIKRLLINVPPRYGKTELLIHFVPWTLSIFPDCQYIYTSYAKSLATKQTSTIRSILESYTYQRYFDLRLSPTTNSKDEFDTVQGGSIYAVGADGAITGRGAGRRGSDRFSGAIIIDDIHKPKDVHSDIIRESQISWYHNTLLSRRNNTDNTPMIFIGQRLHEDDLAGRLLNGFDGHDWHKIILPALDDNENALYPEMHTVEQLKLLEKISPYDFSSQYQQTPQPSGGGIFKRENFVLLDDYPRINYTFITVDTAETAKNYNDATVFSFWGAYEIEYANVFTGKYAIHWIDCMEIRIEPKDLKSAFDDFYRDCMRFDVKPTKVFIEKKSTGTTLVSVLKEIPGLNVIGIERTIESGSKTRRFLDCQPYVNARQLSLPRDAKHTKMCIDHMCKITANDSHRHDDIADTCADAINEALIKQTVVRTKEASQKLSKFAQEYAKSNPLAR